MRLIIVLLALIVVACGTMPYAIPSATDLIARANLPAELLAHNRERALVRVRPLAWDSMSGGAAADYAGQLAAEGGTRPPEISTGAESPSRAHQPGIASAAAAGWSNSPASSTSRYSCWSR